MEKIPFENGTLVTSSKVIINEVEYEVRPAEYTGETPLNAGNLNQMQDNIEEAIEGMLKLTFPIGSTYITQTDTNPSTILGFGTWERVKGRVLVGLDENDEDFNEIGKEGGETKHKMTLEELVPHLHNMIGIPKEYEWVAPKSGINYSFTDQETYLQHTGTTGSGQPFNITQPYKVVGYMWLRTA